jgi:hypothetical protein
MPGFTMPELNTQDIQPLNFEPVASAQHDYLRPEAIDLFNWPVYRRFAEGPFFAVVTDTIINVDRLQAAYADKLLRAVQLDRKRRGWRTEHAQLLFGLGDDCLLFVNSNRRGCRVFARDRGVAERTAREITDRFRVRRPTKAKPCFYLLSEEAGVMSARPVEQPKVRTLAADELDLIYGECFAAWEARLVANMLERPSGVTILRGPAGTGKTSFLRHLMARLAKSHRFYYLASTYFHLLSSPSLLPFWAEEHRASPHLTKVIFLEDAESLLELRQGSDEFLRDRVSNLLNIGDGLLGNFLRMHLVCTVNCEMAQLDPAVIRSGRLLAFREFPRIDRAQAERIASYHDRELPPQEEWPQPDWSLAEIFCGPATCATERPRRLLGFAAGRS